METLSIEKMDDLKDEELKDPRGIDLEETLNIIVSGRNLQQVLSNNLGNGAIQIQTNSPLNSYKSPSALRRDRGELLSKYRSPKHKLEFL
mmetsp:Transcript_15728/g.24171  ORF Transcript_15728/g.24171 Transcript_15728/m.24171 type:complete len:90 (-) Transcript_15728:2841-3110(-)